MCLCVCAGVLSAAGHGAGSPGTHGQSPAELRPTADAVRMSLDDAAQRSAPPPSHGVLSKHTAGGAASSEAAPGGAGGAPSDSRKQLPSHSPSSSSSSATVGATGPAAHASSRSAAAAAGSTTPASTSSGSGGSSSQAHQADEAGAPPAPTPTFVPPTGMYACSAEPPLSREERARGEKPKGSLAFAVVTNDGHPQHVVWLVGAKCIFSQQLPKVSCTRQAHGLAPGSSSDRSCKLCSEPSST